MIQEFVARSSTLAERLQGGIFGVAPDSFDPHRAGQRWERWVRLAAEGDEGALVRRLEWDGLTTAEVRHVLGAEPVICSDSFPPWARLLEEVIHLAPTFEEAGSEIADRQSFLRALLAPFVHVGTRNLKAPVPLDRSLFSRLTLSSARTFESEVEKCMSKGELLLAEGAGIPRYIYEERGPDIVRTLLRDGYRTFLGAYPVLGRILASTTLKWESSAKDLLARIEGDRNELEDLVGERLGRLVGLIPDLSDPNPQGFSVSVLRFESGAQVVYKPRGMALDRAFGGLLEWWNKGGGELDLRSPRLLDRGSYGWVEFVEPGEQPNGSARTRFSRRVGAILALLYALRATDVHAENFTRCGEYPVVLDLECLVNPVHRKFSSLLGRDEPGDPARHSVLSIGVLPRWDPLDGGRRFEDTTALGQSVDREVQEEVIAGFRMAYEHLADSRRELLAPDGPLQAFRGCTMRIVARRTDAYVSIYCSATLPSTLSDGVDHEIAQEVLCRGWLDSLDRPLGWALVREEKRAFEESTIPHFGARTDSTELDVGVCPPIPGFSLESGLGAVCRRIEELSEDDLRLQERLIRAAFLTECGQGARCSASTHRGASDFREEANRIASRIVEWSMEDSQGMPGWFGFRRLPGARVVSFGPLPEDHREGRCGVLSFLAALDRGKARRELIARSLAPLFRAVRIHAAHPDELASIRFARNFGSVLYGLCRIGTLLGEPEVVQAALMASPLLPVGADSVLALTALYRETEEQPLLQAAREMLKQAPEGPDWSLASVWLFDFTRDEADLRLGGLPPELGVLLARFDGGSRFRERVDRAIEVLSQIPKESPDHLAGGIAWRIDLLLAARQQSLTLAAERLGGSMVGLAKERGGYDLGVGAPGEAPDPAFRFGLSGIGYSLLRLVDPDLPSILLGE